jgi:hypothetical protein
VLERLTLAKRAQRGLERVDDVAGRGCRDVPTRETTSAATVWTFDGSGSRSYRSGTRVNSDVINRPSIFPATRPYQLTG